MVLNKVHNTPDRENASKTKDSVEDNEFPPRWNLSVFIYWKKKS